MSEKVVIERRFELEVRRCWCSRFYAYEPGSTVYRCPRCAEEQRMEERARAEKLERRINSLRGVITRLGGKRGRR